MNLDLIAALTAFGYLSLMYTAIGLQRIGTATLRRLTLAFRLYVIAIGVQAVNLITNIASIPDDGIGWALLPAVTLILAIYLTVLARRERDRKGAAVLRDAERTVQQWRDGAL